MSKTTLAGAVMACISLMAASESAAAATCADRTHVVTQLSERFGETLRGNAVSSRQDEILEIYSTPRNETWTILVTLPDRGLSCLLASGRGADRLNASLQLL